MAKKRMCPHYNCLNPITGVKTIIGDCPINTNDNCEIIPKRKPKVRRVKAWWCRHCEQAEKVKHANYFCEGSSVPCTIVIDEKHLKEKQ